MCVHVYPLGRVSLSISYVSKLCKDGTKLAPKFTIMETYSEHFPTAQACYECTVVLPLCSALPNMRVEVSTVNHTRTHAHSQIQ